MKHRLWINGKWTEGKHLKPVSAPFDGALAAEAWQADSAQMEEALAAADKAFHSFRRASAFVRSALLAAMARGIEARRKEFSDRIVFEAGKPRKLADVEVSRAIFNFNNAAEEARRFGGDLIPIDLDAGGRAFSPAVSEWVPRGPVLAIGPFNFPLNLLAHKVAPALAVGTSVIMKPPPQAPGAATLLAEVFAEAAKSVGDARETVPFALLQLINGPNEVIAKAVTDSRVGVLSFTGSDKVGWMLQSQAVRKKVALELGGNAAAIVHADADLARAANRCAFGAFAYAGQICISIQRIFVHRSVEKKFRELFLAEVAKLKVGDPAAEETVVGPLIDGANAERVLAWIAEASEGGAELLTGGQRQGNVITPAVLTGTKSTDKVNAEEIFGPVVTLTAYDTIEEAILAVNGSRFGLQAGIFSDSAKVIRQASVELEVGGIIVNEIPTFRADNMPYGGMKDSGLGREGVRYAMEDFCERRTLVSWHG